MEKKNANCGLETTIIISRPAKVFEYSFIVVQGKNIIFFKLQKLPYGNTKISRGLENYKKILHRKLVITHFILREKKGKNLINFLSSKFFIFSKIMRRSFVITPYLLGVSIIHS